MLVCSYSWGKSWHKNWLAGKFLSPICHLTLGAQLYVNSMSPLMPGSEGETTGHFPMICLSRHGSDQAWLMDGCPVVGNVSTGLLRKYSFAVFSGWHLLLQSKTRGKQGVGFCPRKSRVLKRSVSSYVPRLRVHVSGRPVIPFATNPVSGLMTSREQFVHRDQGFPGFVCLTVCFANPQLISVEPHKGDDSERSSWLDSQRSEGVNEMCSSEHCFWREESLSWRGVLHEPGRGPGSVWSGLRI